jgi:sodium-independent sulfate anion transporter 11
LRLQFHFATILSPWIRRALVAGGFGYGTPHSTVAPEVAEVIPDYSEKEGREELNRPRVDVESDGSIRTVTRQQESRTELKGWASLLPQDTPFFHPDLSSAVRAAESGLDRVTKFDDKLRQLEDSG